MCVCVCVCVRVIKGTNTFGAGEHFIDTFDTVSDLYLLEDLPRVVL